MIPGLSYLKETFMHIDLFWSGVAVGAVGLFLMIRLMDGVIYPLLRKRKKGDSA
jgi:hypothetical protein